MDKPTPQAITILDNVSTTQTSPAQNISNAKRVAIQMKMESVESRTAVLTVLTAIDNISDEYVAYNMLLKNLTDANSADTTLVSSISMNTNTVEILGMAGIPLGLGFKFMKAVVTFDDQSNSVSSSASASVSPSTSVSSSRSASPSPSTSLSSSPSRSISSSPSSSLSVSSSVSPSPSTSVSPSASISPSASLSPSKSVSSSPSSSASPSASSLSPSVSGSISASPSISPSSSTSPSVSVSSSVSSSVSASPSPTTPTGGVTVKLMIEY